MIASLVILVLVLLGFLWWWIVQPHGHDALGRDAQLPLFSVRTPGSSLRVIGVGARRTRSAAPQSASQPAPAPTRATSPAAGAPTSAAPPAAARATAEVGSVTASSNGTGHAPPAAADPALRSTAGVRRPRRPRPVVEPTSSVEADGVVREAVKPEELKWAPPTQPAPSNGTVEFLPGRLDVVQGRGVAGQEVRFVRPSRPGERAVVTFGRGEGPPYRHVQLNVPTVSRLHARLSLDDASGWVVENLSSTNPTVVNGEELVAGDAPRPLRDGDRLEMGEVVFTYHAR